jgi:hypothetical protein
LRPPPGPGTSIDVVGAISRADVPLLCDRLHVLLADRSADPVVVCEVSRLVVNLDAVDALARLQLAAVRLGGRITLAGRPPELDELLGICGLSGLFRSDR